MRRSTVLAKVKGLHAGRLLHSEREATFAAKWKERVAGGILTHLISEYVTDNQAEIAATVVQWLGSDVGLSFLRECVKANPNIKQYLELD